MSQCAMLLLAALVFDVLIGDPRYPYHPVRLIGSVISGFERRLYRSGRAGLLRGFIFTVCVVGSVLGSVYVLVHVLSLFHSIARLLFSIYIVYSCIAYRDLESHCRTVQRALLQKDILVARSAVGMIVGRDASRLDSAGIGRAVIETLAENFVDGFLAPVFWYAAGCVFGKYLQMDASCAGVLLIVVYRTVNTLDSMVGYRNDRYRYFGRVSARCDDIMNSIPARLSIVFLTVAALFSGMNSLACVRTACRDRLKHASPNAGHPESCVAGALGIQLGGPIRYPFGTVEKPWMGSGTHAVTTCHVNDALKLVRSAFVISTISMLLILTLV